MLKRIREIPSERAYGVDQAADAVLLVAAATVAATRRGSFHVEVAGLMFAVSAAAWLLAGRAIRQYHGDSGRGLRGDIALTLVMLAAIAAPLVASGLLFPAVLPLETTALFLFALVPAVLLVRVRMVGLALWRARPIEAVRIVGTGSLGRLTGTSIEDGKTRRRVLGFLRFDDEPAPRRLPAPLLGAASDLAAMLREHAADEVYLASSAPEHRDIVQRAIGTCEELGVPFALPACPYRLTRARPTDRAWVADGYAHFTNVRVTPVGQALKRLFDIVISGAALVALSLLLVVAVLVKLTSRGPVLFRQERVGLLGRRFHMLKFRSMVQDAEALKAKLVAQNEQSGPVFKMKHDPRVTAVGRVIRKYSIDELPQLLNVLRGDMSLVGPRPPLPTEVAKYEAWQRRRLSVRPGITCVWQVSGRNEITFQEWMLLDMRYIDHWSFTGDLGLLLKTVPVVITGRGAS